MAKTVGELFNDETAFLRAQNECLKKRIDRMTKRYGETSFPLGIPVGALYASFEGRHFDGEEDTGETETIIEIVDDSKVIPRIKAIPRKPRFRFNDTPKTPKAQKAAKTREVPRKNAPQKKSNPAEVSSARVCHVYFISDGNGFVKIGVAQNISNRIRALATSNSTELTLLNKITFLGYKAKKRAYQCEGRLHAAFVDNRVRGEWYDHHIAEMVENDFDNIVSLYGGDGCTEH